MKDVEIYTVGPLSLSCCALKLLSKEEVERDVNQQNIAGTTLGWVIAKESTFKDGEKIPHQCEHYEDRQHWLFHC